MAFGFFKKKGSSDKVQKKGGPHYFELTVKEIVEETSDAVSVVFDISPEDMPYKPGQFLTIILNIDGKEVRRSYSLSSSPFKDPYLAVTIKRVEGGLVSNYIPDHLKAGDTVKVMEPMGSFTTDYDEKKKRHLVLFAGGSGITPMMSILKSLLLKEPKSIVSLIYANRNIESVIFKEELSNWENSQEGRLHVIHILDNAPMNWQGFSGLLNADMLVDLFERIPDWGNEDTTYLMCGPEGMMRNVDMLLKDKGIDHDKIFKESFVQGTIDKEKKKAEKSASEQSAPGECLVKIHYDGEVHEIKLKKDEFILETALDKGIDLPYSCQSGLCTACRCKKINGNVKMDEEEGLSESELNEGYVLICVGHPDSDVVELEVG